MRGQAFVTFSSTELAQEALVSTHHLWKEFHFRMWSFLRCIRISETCCSVHPSHVVSYTGALIMVMMDAYVDHFLKIFGLILKPTIYSCWCCWQGLTNGYILKGKPMVIQFGRNPSAAKPPIPTWVYPLVVHQILVCWNRTLTEGNYCHKFQRKESQEKVLNRCCIDGPEVKFYFNFGLKCRVVGRPETWRYHYLQAGNLSRWTSVMTLSTKIENRIYKPLGLWRCKLESPWNFRITFLHVWWVCFYK